MNAIVTVIVRPSIITPPVPVKRLYRVLHDYEIYAVREFTYAPQYDHVDKWYWRNGDPEVFWLEGSHQVPLDESWQRLIMGLNPGMDGKKLRVVWDFMRAFSNGLGKGFDTVHSPLSADYVPLRDYFTNRDLTVTGTLRKDKVRVCGGAVVRGVMDGDFLLVDTLDGNQPAPALDWVLPRNWLYFEAVTTHQRVTDGAPQIARFVHNGGSPVYIPLVARLPVRIPLGILQDMNEIQGVYDPLKIYLT